MRLETKMAQPFVHFAHPGRKVTIILFSLTKSFQTVLSKSKKVLDSNLQVCHNSVFECSKEIGFRLAEAVGLLKY